MANNRAMGSFGERQAIKYLKNNGYILLAKNFNTYFGEIDIIAKQNDVIVFIEVKARKNANYGYPYEAVNNKKQQKIIKTAYAYIKKMNLKNYQYRFDIIEVYLCGSSQYKINHILDAFWLTD
ncbi:Endonuclease [Caldisalinibacter kiritimatiensis]|uniref:UPF0102 protein L21TH_2670 n=1 Tax=Caldisalinibacter kiritimatiensis TaxID=1304284 RepID=R1ARL5_9FIRM|nr:Endonuclease [Caldisalinibacter kiritimatiensis]